MLKSLYYSKFVEIEAYVGIGLAFAYDYKLMELVIVLPFLHFTVNLEKLL